MPSPVMQIGAALVVACLGGIGAVNASKLQMRSHEAYYAALVVSIATMMMGGMGRMPDAIFDSLVGHAPCVAT